MKQMERAHFTLSDIFRVASIGLIICLFGISTLSAAMAADLYGFVIGINDYQHNEKLDGAVNDARDIASALEEAGAREVILLLDKEADRDTVFAKWREIVGHAKKGDVLVFSYAGHGSREPEHVKGSEPSGLDSNFLLSGFAPKDKDSYQRIVDDEVGVMLREDAAHLHVLFIADSCHSGTMTRSFSIAPKRIKYRFVPTILRIKNDALTKLYSAKVRGEHSDRVSNNTVGIAAEEAPNVFAIGAVSDHELDPEITTTDGQRGALSVAVAQAFRGGAGSNESISRQELEHYVKENVRMLVDGQQHPQFSFGRDDFTIPIKREKASPTAIRVDGNSASTSKGETPPSDSVRISNKPMHINLFVTNVQSGITENQWRSQLGMIQITDQMQHAQVIWNIGEEKIISQLGDVLYDGKQSKINDSVFSRQTSFQNSPISARVTAGNLSYAAKVFDKLFLVERIKNRSETVSPVMVLKPDDRVHLAGEQVTLEISGQQYQYLTLFNIASDGTINYLYPLNEGSINDSLLVPLNKPHALPLTVEPPFGADHFVVIFSDKALTGLHRELASMNGGKNADKVEAALDRYLQRGRYQMGIYGVYTGK